jgi:acyl-CoA synthetase (AMP-forming)/AMP-acid ligase II
VETTANIGGVLAEAARARPWQRAVVVPARRGADGRMAYAHLTFQQAEVLSERFAAGLAAAGVEPGMRTLLMVRPGLEFAPLVFALFRLGAVPVLIDPGMGWRSLVHAVAQAQPAVFVGIPAAHVLRLLAPASFRSVRIAVCLARHGLPGARSLREWARRGQGRAAGLHAAGADDTAAVLFTSGSTGPAKGVVYTHGMFQAQVRLLRDLFGLGPGDIDLPCFPLFALFSLGLGATIVVPRMDFTRPARVNPMDIIEPVLEQGVTCSFGSPALWRVVGRYCERHGIRLPSLRKLFMAGAPVAPELHECLLRHVLAPGAETYTPYGATEALPVAVFAGSEVLANTAARSREGAGTCVGRPVPGVTLRVIPVTDAAVAEWQPERCLSSGQIGELAVRGEVVTPAYYGLPEATRLAKIPAADGGVWHRLGDVGYVDTEGRAWFCGRKAHRVETAAGPLYSVPCEAIFNQHPRVYRSALVGVGPAGRQEPVIVVEPEPGQFPAGRQAREAFAAELLALGRAKPLTAAIETVLFHRAFPVDVRHNVKIRREELALWAGRVLGRRAAAGAVRSPR